MAVMEGSEVDIVQIIDYSRINHLYKINTVTLNALCLWDLRKEKRASIQGEVDLVAVTANKRGKKFYQKYFYVKVRIESPCVSHSYYFFLKSLRKVKEKINHNR